MGLVGLPLRVASRGLSGLSRVAGFPDIAERLDRRAAHVESQLDAIASLGRTLAQRAERILTTIERLDERAEAILDAAERIAEVGNAILAVGEAIVATGAEIVVRADAIVLTGGRIVDRGEGIIAAGERIMAKGDEIVLAGEQMAAAVPTINRAVDIITPLEGMVERLGRISDRLPGGRATRRSRRSQDGTAEAEPPAG